MRREDRHRGRWLAAGRSLLWLGLVSLHLALCAGANLALGAGATRSILLLHSNQTVLPATVAADHAVRGIFSSDPSAKVEVFTEFLDIERFPAPEDLDRMARFLGDKYAKHRIDLIITTGTWALDFLLQRRATLFPDAPIVFSGVTAAELAARDLPAGITGVVSTQDPAPTVALALRLQPDARQLFIVTGATSVSKEWSAMARRSIAAAFGDRLQIHFLSGLPVAELLRQLGKLPADSFVLYFSILRDGAGQTFIPRDLADKLSAAASVPVYGIFDTYVGHGIVGGNMDTFDAQGAQTARLALRLLKGGDPAAVPAREISTTSPIIDWRQLRRWRISESRLPEGTIVRYREPSAWDVHKRQIIAACVLLAAQSALIVLLLLQRRRRRLVEASLQDSEERMELAAISAHIGLWHWDIAANRVWATDSCRQMTGLEADAPATLEQFLGAVQADQRDATLWSFRDAAASGTALRRTWRMTAPDGSERWISANARIRSDPSGASRMMGVLTDISQERQAQLEAQQRQQELTHLARVATLGELSGAIAHELNQPLTAILGNAQAARLILARRDHDLEEIRAILEDIVADGSRAGEVIRRLRTMFRKAEALLEPLDLNEVAAEVLELAHGELLERRVSVTASLAADLPAIRGDAIQLKQVLLNIVINACDAMNDNQAAERGLTVTTARGEPGMVQVAVADRGSGIEPGLLERLFEPFVTTKAKGLGLGLSICRSIVAAHGGRLWAANNQDKGATFWVALPAAEGSRR
jgi:C4-dicarboxylate-specific signal transduction histidine kinase